MSPKDFAKRFERRITDDSIKIPKALEANFLQPENDDEQQIKGLIETYYGQRTRALEEGLFKQKKRLADADRKLQGKITKAAQNEQRIATTKIDWHLEKITDLKRTDLKPRDSRIFPQVYAPVVVVENGLHNPCDFLGAQPTLTI